MAENSIWNGTTAYDPLSGRVWGACVIGGETWYPAARRRYYTSGTFQIWGGWCITTTIDPELNVSALHFSYSETLVDIAETHSRAHGHSVRCVRL